MYIASAPIKLNPPAHRVSTNVKSVNDMQNNNAITNDIVKLIMHRCFLCFSRTLSFSTKALDIIPEVIDIIRMSFKREKSIILSASIIFYVLIVF